jgi:hypothetical protein
MQRVLPILLVAILIGLDWVRHHYEGVVAPTTGRTLLFRVGVVVVVAAITKLLLTRRWTLQDLGFVSILLGVGGFLIRILYRLGPQPVPEWERDLMQSMLEVGLVLMILGLFLLFFSFVVQGLRHRREGRS